MMICSCLPLRGNIRATSLLRFFGCPKELNCRIPNIAVDAILQRTDICVARLAVGIGRCIDISGMGGIVTGMTSAYYFH